MKSLSLKKKTIFNLTFLMLIPMLITGVVSLQLVLKRMASEVALKSSERNQLLAKDFKNHFSEAGTISKLVANYASHLEGELSSSDLSDFLEQNKSLWFYAIVEIFAPDRSLIARTFDRDPRTERFLSKADDPLISDGFNLTIKTELVSRDAGLLIKSVVPIVNPMTLEVKGVVMVSFPLNFNFLSILSSKLGSEVLVSWDSGTKIVGTSLNPEKHHLSSFNETSLNRNSLNMDFSQLMQATLHHKNYMLAFSPLKNSEERLMGWMAVATDVSEIERTRVESFQVLALSSAAFFIFSFLVGIVFGNSLTNPILNLVSATKQLASGNLDIRVQSNRSDELGILALSFNKMGDDLKEKIGDLTRLNTEVSGLNSELAKYVGHVEELAEAKSAKIKAIMHNINQGIFTLEGSEEVAIGPDYSEHLESILCEKDLEKKSFVEIFLSKLDLNKDQKSQMFSVLSSAIGNSPLNYVLNAHLMPKEGTILTESGRKEIEIDWGTVVQKEEVQAILVSIRDVTEKNKLKESAERSQRELGIIGRILKIPPDQFSQFIGSARNFVNNSQDLIERHTIGKEEILKVMFINMHTLKGAARSCDMTHMTEKIHEVEEAYDKIRKGLKEWDQDELLGSIQEVAQLIEESASINEGKLGRKESPEEIRVNRRFLMRLYRYFQSLGLKGSSDFDVLETPFKNMLFKYTGEIIRHFGNDLTRLAKDLGKESPSLDIIGSHRFVTQEGYELLRDVFLHILRNAMDHGIEAAEIREKKGKPREGSITVLVGTEKDQLVIKVSDDGQGLNLKQIEKIALERGLIDQNDHFSEDIVASQILVPGFSTAFEVTEISGRGVGMDAVNTSLREAGGALDIVLKEEHPDGFRAFEFVIFLPAYFLG